MASDYTSWKGLVDRTYTGRHLPAVDPSAQAHLPSEEDVNALFLRDVEVKSTDTSVMFVFFAQWFTDSFLRTDHSDMRKNTSNHEIDLCQIYGLKEDKTTMLRSHQGGRLRSQVIDGAEYPEFLFQPAPRPQRLQREHLLGRRDEGDQVHEVAAADRGPQLGPEKKVQVSFKVMLTHDGTWLLAS